MPNGIGVSVPPHNSNFFLVLVSVSVSVSMKTPWYEWQCRFERFPRFSKIFLGLLKSPWLERVFTNSKLNYFSCYICTNFFSQLLWLNLKCISSSLFHWMENILNFFFTKANPIFVISFKHNYFRFIKKRLMEFLQFMPFVCRGGQWWYNFL